MGRDLTLYPKSANRRELKLFLEELGFRKTSHLWSWPKGTLNYHWFETTDFQSITGVEADIYPVEGEEALVTGNPWALHVRNTYSASWYDVAMLNDVLKTARKKFGGTIKGDYGTNRYAPLWDDESTPISRGLSAAYRNVTDKISAIKYSLPPPSLAVNPEGDKDILDFMNQMDPTRVLYNGLVPFAVAMFEFFFAEAFEILISYDTYALQKRLEHKQKVDFSTLLQVGENGRSIESVIASSFTFQNLNQLNKAYKEWLNIDVRKLLFKKKKIGSSISFLENQIAEIIQYRHGIIHGFEIDRSLSKEKYEDILDAVEKAIEEFVFYIEKKYKIKVDRH